MDLGEKLSIGGPTLVMPPHTLSPPPSDVLKRKADKPTSNGTAENRQKVVPLFSGRT